MQENKPLPEVLYVAEVTRDIYQVAPFPEPGHGTNGMRLQTVIQGVAVEIRDNWEDFPDGTVFAVYRMERMRAVQRAVELVDVPMPERRK